MTAHSEIEIDLTRLDGAADGLTADLRTLAASAKVALQGITETTTRGDDGGTAQGGDGGGGPDRPELLQRMGLAL